MQILVLEDIPETRDWLIRILAKAFGADLTIEAAATRADGLARVRKSVFDLALIDLGLPDGDGLDVLRALKITQPETLTIVTTILADDAYIVAALSAGAEGYLLKDQPEDVLIHQLRQQRDGVPALSPRIARRIMEHFRFTASPDDDASLLTDREAEVLGLIGRGFRNADVANDLGLTENTVAGYIKAVYRKLNISSRAEASWHANRLGLLWKR
jgi:DNA-binding NarL/FixJ family response regulator